MSRYEYRTVTTDKNSYSVALRYSNHPQGMSSKPIPVAGRRAYITYTMLGETESDALDIIKAEIEAEEKKYILSEDQLKAAQYILESHCAKISKALLSGLSLRAAKKMNPIAPEYDRARSAIENHKKFSA